MRLKIVNIWLEKKFLIINQDETLCPICNGLGGWYPFTKDEAPGLKFITMCTHCEGQGKIDWVTRIMKPPRSEERDKLKSKWKVSSKAWRKID